MWEKPGLRGFSRLIGLPKHVLFRPFIANHCRTSAYGCFPLYRTFGPQFHVSTPLKNKRFGLQTKPVCLPKPLRRSRHNTQTNPPTRRRARHRAR
jgi:hypothetical protein